MTDIKDCPFCGGKAEYSYSDMIGDTYSESGEVHSIDCLDCGVYMHVDNLDRKNTKEVYEKWNKRVEDGQ